MQPNVLKFPGHIQAADQFDLLEAYRAHKQGDVYSAACAIQRSVHGQKLKIMIWHDLGTLEPMVDADGEPLSCRLFGWREEESGYWHDPDRAMRSPLIAAARIANETLIISRNGIRSDERNCLFEDIAVGDLEANTGLCAAIVVPIHMALGRLGAAILTSLSPGREDLSAHFSWAAQTLAPVLARFVANYASMHNDQRYMPSNPVLSRRELECLTWIARGKTDHEISIILGCSHAGVRYHVGRIGEKLGSVNRAQSVFRACQLGYLSCPF